MPAPTIVLLMLVSDTVAPLSMMKLFPLDDIDSVPPPDSVTLASMSKVAPLPPLVPCSLIEPPLVMTAAPSVRVPPSTTLTNRNW